MLRIALVEDEPDVQCQLTEYIHRYEQEAGEKFEMTVFSDGIDIVSDYTGGYDIIFLDIQMRHMDGMTAAKRIREMDQNVVIVFITNMANYAIRGYAVNATDYVLKPVPYFAFSQVLQRAISRVKTLTQSHLMLPIEGGVIKLSTAEVIYIESISRHLVVHTKTKAFTVSGTLKDMEQKLENLHFFRCNNCYLVNLAHVENVKHNDLTVGGYVLQISRPRKKSFMDALADYVGRAR